MAEHLGHERLNVYQKGMPFASMRKTLLDDLPRRVAVIQGTDLPFHFLPEKSLSPRRQARKGTISNPLGDLGGFARK
jgi:hypothetical protein